uniref:Uncharacterized protein n=1 Tax=Grammatophora oceanica TaxID=210454 RepID=A0A7S1UKQ8_9STRA|mmetsp:Transcript_10078/g.14757  ORF Transcript_10078/g.14757 Transcript_10078/m.14757 type:complete len:322 (+) Transcript_10078:758-1723(+)
MWTREFYVNGMFAAINNIHKAIFQWPSLNSDIMMKLSNILKAFLALQVTIARSDDGGIGYDDEKNSKLYDVNYDPFDDINHEVEPFGHRELQLSPSTAACIDACRTEEQLKRTTCFNSYCNDKFPNNVGSATWKEDRKRCKSLCRVAYRQQFAVCKARCRVPEGLTSREQQLCDTCPCCAAGGDFISTLLEPDLCTELGDGGAIFFNQESSLIRCILDEDDVSGVLVDFTQARVGFYSSNFGFTPYCDDIALNDCDTFLSDPDCERETTESIACSDLFSTIRDRVFGTTSTCGSQGFFGQGTETLDQFSYAEYCETAFLVP